MPKKTIEVATPYGHRIAAFEGELITRKILRHGIYDGVVLSYITRLLAKIDQPVVLDIGANIGNHALAMSTQAQQVFCFEPLHEVFDLLKKNVDRNGITNITCINEALSDHAGEQVFYINTSGNLGASSLESRVNNEDADTTTVKMRIGDELVDDQNINSVDFLKIDVEGHELSVLNGLSKTIVQQQPVIVMEWNEQATATRLLEANIFSELLFGYQVFVLGSNYDRSYWQDKVLGGLRRRLTRVLRSKRSQVYPFNPKRLYRNILLVPSAKQSLMDGL